MKLGKNHLKEILHDFRFCSPFLCSKGLFSFMCTNSRYSKVPWAFMGSFPGAQDRGAFFAAAEPTLRAECFVSSRRESLQRRKPSMRYGRIGGWDPRGVKMSRDHGTLAWHILGELAEYSRTAPLS